MKPNTAHLELTNRCNLRCKKCPVNNNMKRTKTDMPFDLIKKIMDENPQIKAYGLNNWGEPLLHPQFKEITQHLTNKTCHQYTSR